MIKVICKAYGCNPKSLKWKYHEFNDCHYYHCNPIKGGLFCAYCNGNENYLSKIKKEDRCSQMKVIRKPMAKCYECEVMEECWLLK